MSWQPDSTKVIILIIIDNFCIAIFSGVLRYKLTILYNILQKVVVDVKRFGLKNSSFLTIIMTTKVLSCIAMVV